MSDHSTIENVHFDIQLDELLTCDPININCPFFEKIGFPLPKIASLCIPYWQRDYDWGKGLIARFIDDLEKSHSHPFRVGTVVLGRLADSNEFIVIDGQQRLRTINNLCLYAQNSNDLSLPLYYGVGEDKLLLTKELCETKDQATLEQIGAFTNWDKTIDSSVNLKDLLKRIHLHVIVATFNTDGMEDVEGAFNRAMSSLFSRINAQAKPLDDIDLVKARLLLRLREKEDVNVSRFSKVWETARAIVMTNSNCREVDKLLNTKLDDRGIENIEEYIAKDMDDETLRLQFSRYLLMVNALYRNDIGFIKQYSSSDLRAINGPIKEKFQDLLNDVSLQAAETFFETLEKVNNIFLQWRPYLLVRRSQLIEKAIHTTDSEVDRLKLRFLQMQCVVNAGSPSSRNWLESKFLFLILKEILNSSNAHSNESTIEELLRNLENNLFSRISEQNESGLTARDWFLWRTLFDKTEPERELEMVMLNGLSEIDLTKFGCSRSSMDLYKEMRKIGKDYIEMFPSMTGATQIEHWVARTDNKSKHCEDFANKAHIAVGVNQSLSDKRIQEKATNIEAKWWPTLKFLAIVTQLHDLKEIKTQQDSTDKGTENIDIFLEMLQKFWSKVNLELNGSLGNPK